jgi:hypothetical protein
MATTAIATPTTIDFQRAVRLTLELARDFDINRRLRIPVADPTVPVKFRPFYRRLWWLVVNNRATQSALTEHLLELSDAVFASTRDATHSATRDELADLFLANMADLLTVGSSVLIVELSREALR